MESSVGYSADNPGYENDAPVDKSIEEGSVYAVIPESIPLPSKAPSTSLLKHLKYQKKCLAAILLSV